MKRTASFILLAAGALLSLGAAAAPLSPPRIPAHGAYLGVFVNPEGLKRPITGEKASKTLSQLPAFDFAVGRPVAILHAFSGFLDPFPSETLREIDRQGSIPLLDWHCGMLSEINTGKRDAVIHAYARAARAFGKPMFIRWYWEMNLDKHKAKSCDAYDNGAGFIAAWRRIRTTFRDEGADNVAFVWCPSVHGDFARYYPGDGFVDWVAGDNFDRRMLGEEAFARLFGPFIGSLPSRGKPVMIGATGAPEADQAAFLRGIARDAPKFPRVKAIMYFDAPGKYGFQLRGDGLAAFRALLADPYFSVSDHR